MDLGRSAQTDPKEFEQAMSTTATKELEPLPLFEDDTGAQFLIYNTIKGAQTELRFVDEQPWFTQAQLAYMFGVDVRTVNHHVQQFLSDGELDASTIRKFRIVRNEGNRQVEREIEHYSLDVAFYVGYRVNSKEGILFRRWATQVLLQYAIKGFVVHKERLMDPKEYGRVQELRRIIAEIRASDINFYGELRQICAMAKNYDPKSPAWHSTRICAPSFIGRLFQERRQCSWRSEPMRVPPTWVFNRGLVTESYKKTLRPRCAT